VKKSMPETWLLLSLASAFLIALTDVLDKILLGRRVLGVLAFTTMSGIVQMLLGIALLAAAGFPANAPPGVLALVVFTGVLSAVAAYLFYKSVSQGEVGRLISILYTFPLFTLVLAALFLGEKVTSLQAAGTLLIVAGAALTSIKKTAHANFARSFKLRGGALLMLGVAVIGSVINVAEKKALAFVSPNAFMGVNGVVFGCVMLLFLARKKARGEVARLLARPKIMGAVIANDVIAFASYVLYAMAVSLTLVSLVAPISAVRPLIVLAIAAFLTRFAPHLVKEEFDGRTAAVKIAGGLIIVIGAALVIT